MVNPKYPNSAQEEDFSLFALLQEFNLFPTKALGQVFLDDRRTLGAILKILDPKDEDLIVEIGAGPGLVTRELAKRAGRVLAVEIDPKFKPLHERLFEDLARPPLMLYEDARKVEFEGLLERKGRLLVFGNLPYYLTTDLILVALNRFPDMDLALFMVEEEVRERLLAQAGSKKYGTLSVSTGLFGSWRFERTVSRTAFFPKPRITSALLSLIPGEDEEAKEIASDLAFHRFMTGLMQSRRKTLANALKLAAFWRERETFARGYQAFLDSLGRGPDLRAEGLPPSDLARLFSIVREDGIL